MTECADVQRILADPGADELSRRRARQHAAACAACSPALQAGAARSGRVDDRDPHHELEHGPDDWDGRDDPDDHAGDLVTPPVAALEARLRAMSGLGPAAAGTAGAPRSPGGTTIAARNTAPRPTSQGAHPSWTTRPASGPHEEWSDVAPDRPEIADRVLGRLRTHRPAPGRILRLVLAVTSAVELVLSVPWLLGANPYTALGSATGRHLTRDGALGIATAVAGLVAARRPRWAMSMLALCAAVIAMQVAGGLVDNQDQGVGGAFEFVHALTLAIVVLVCAMAVRRERPPGPRTR